MVDTDHRPGAFRVAPDTAPARDTVEATGRVQAPRAAATDARTDTDRARWWQQPLDGRGLGEVFATDVRQFHRELWKGVTDTATAPSAALVAGAGGLSFVSRGEWDAGVDRFFDRQDKTAWDKTGELGNVVGHPGLHFGLAAAAYVWSIETGDDELYGFSKTLTHALALNGLTTVALKVAVADDDPGGELYAWPSGHTSSSATVAAVVWEEAGPVAGIPAYLVAGWVAVSRVNDGEHWLGDVIFGGVLGSVIGHSVARGRALEVAEFTVLPWVPRQGGAGVMFLRRF